MIIPDHQEFLKDCNALIKWTQESAWQPAICRGGAYYTPTGIQLVPPKYTKPATIEEIYLEIDMSHFTSTKPH